MDNPGLPETLWSLLNGRLWHATSPDGLAGILADSEIRLAKGEKYQNSFCRSLGGVCLFDFGPSAVNECNQFSNWTGWFGGQQCSRIAIWLCINRDLVGDNLLDAGATHVRWQDACHTQIIPGVEAYHKGPIPLAAVVSALLIARDDKKVFQQLVEFPAGVFRQMEDFGAKLPPPPDNGIIEAFEAAKNRIKRIKEGE